LLRVRFVARDAVRDFFARVFFAWAISWKPEVGNQKSDAGQSELTSDLGPLISDLICRY